MVISITEKCRMGCTHCMDDARADSDKFMTKETFIKALRFNLKYDRSITITGGEPTEHPQFWEFMGIVADELKFNQIASICSNGMNFTDDDIPKVEYLKENCKGIILYQISSIKPYYPIFIDLDQKIFKRKDFVVCRKLEKLDEMGRAAQHKNWIFTSKAPTCFNIRSIIRSTKDFPMAVSLLRSQNKFCTPQIAYDGSIKVGESTLCPPVAHIDDSLSVIADKIDKFRCNTCQGCINVLKKLPPIYREAIGEEQI